MHTINLTDTELVHLREFLESEGDRLGDFAMNDAAPDEREHALRILDSVASVQRKLGSREARSSANDTHTLPNDGRRDVQFDGRELATVRGPERKGRQTTLTLYVTRAGAFVAHECNRSTNEGERDRHTVHVCPNEDALIEAVGTGPLARHLYLNAAIACVEVVR